jgi:hypothetical protein
MPLSAAPSRPSSLCLDQPNALMKSVDKELDEADSAAKAGNAQKAQQLREKARTELMGVVATTAAGAELILAIRILANATYQFPTSVQEKLEVGSRFARMGDDQAAHRWLDEAKGEFGKWANGELGSAADGFWAEAIAYQAKQLGMDDLASKAMSYAQKWFDKKFNDALAAVPCPPGKDQVEELLQELSDAMHRGLISPDDQGMAGSSWQAAMAKVEAYIRASAPTVAAGKARSDLALGAAKLGFPALARDIMDNKQVDPPRCAISTRRNVSDPGFMNLQWFAYSCQGPKGPWHADLYLVYTIVSPSPGWVLHYTWSFESIPGLSSAQPAGVERTAPGGASNSDAFIAYIDDPLPVGTDGKVLIVNFPVKEGTVAIGRTQEFMETIKSALGGPMPLERKAITQCK